MNGPSNERSRAQCYGSAQSCGCHSATACWRAGACRCCRHAWMSSPGGRAFPFALAARSSTARAACVWPVEAKPPGTRRLGISPCCASHLNMPVSNLRLWAWLRGCEKHRNQGWGSGCGWVVGWAAAVAVSVAMAAARRRCVCVCVCVWEGGGGPWQDKKRGLSGSWRKKISRSSSGSEEKTSKYLRHPSNGRRSLTAAARTSLCSGAWPRARWYVRALGVP
jgi:hypothetical protein